MICFLTLNTNASKNNKKMNKHYLFYSSLIEPEAYFTKKMLNLRYNHRIGFDKISYFIDCL